MHLVRRSCALLLHGGPHGRAPRRGTRPLPRRPRCRCARTSARRTHPRSRQAADAAQLGAHRLPHRVHRRRDADPGRRSRARVHLAGDAPGRPGSRCRADRASSERAAVVAAAYQVLQHYYPAAARQARGRPRREPGRRGARARPSGFGVKVGKRAGAWRPRRASAVTTTWTPPSTTASRPAPGVWQPAPPATRHARRLARLAATPGGQEARSRSTARTPSRAAAYTTQFEEVKSLGRIDLDHAHRGPAADGAVLQRQRRLPCSVTPSSAISSVTRCRLSDTARLFAAVHAAHDRLAHPVLAAQAGRRASGVPSQAIQDAELDGNPATTPRRHLDAADPEPALLRLRERARLRSPARRSR